jgi:hypothetical protein
VSRRARTFVAGYLVIGLAGSAARRVGWEEDGRRKQVRFPRWMIRVRARVVLAARRVRAVAKGGRAGLLVLLLRQGQ